MNSEFPLYKNDKQPWRALYPNQVQELEIINKKIEGGEYRFIDNPCLCGCKDRREDVLLSGKDRYGIGINYLLCKKCALIRAEKILDKESLRLFYKDNYRKLYKGIQVPTSGFVEKDQHPRGQRLANLIEHQVGKGEINKVFELGCSAGGILEQFKKKGWLVSGCDWDLNFLSYGQAQGLDLYYGDIDLEKTPLQSQDLIIMSHVMEHLVDPAEVVRDVSRYVRPGGYLLIEVPGTFTIENPLQFFHISHLFNFYKDFLTIFFTEIGFDIVYGDEFCTFILKKNRNLNDEVEGGAIDYSRLSEKHHDVARHLIDAYQKKNSR